MGWLEKGLEDEMLEMGDNEKLSGRVITWGNGNGVCSFFRGCKDGKVEETEIY